MRVLNNDVALALPEFGELESLAIAIQRARRGSLGACLRVGVGQVDFPPSLRVLGYASIVAKTVKTYAPWFINAGLTLPLTVQSSAQILNALGQTPPVPLLDSVKGLVILGWALRASGFSGSILIDFAIPDLTVSNSLLPHMRLATQTEERLARMQQNHDRHVDPRRYATEHLEIFGDVLPHTNADSALNFFIGGRDEALFWDVRRSARSLAISQGFSLNPTVGLISPALQRPWYHSWGNEPILSNLNDMDMPQITTRLEKSWNPKYGPPAGPPVNAGLKREIEATISFLKEDSNRLGDLLKGVADPATLAVGAHLEIGPLAKIVLQENVHA